MPMPKLGRCFALFAIPDTSFMIPSIAGHKFRINKALN
jgi:hypothetical protein